jgi:hypothetical protein
MEFKWQRVAVIACVLATISFCAAAVPIVQQTLNERETERIRAVYASGLYHCNDYPEDVDAFVQTFLPSQPILSITALPAFSKAQAIRLVGDDLYYFELAFPLYKGSETSRPVLYEDAPKILKTHITARTAQELVSLLAGDIRHARAGFPKAIDGTNYIFRSSGQNCAFSWSPSSESRAGKVTDLFLKLARHAQLEGEAAEGSDQDIYAAARALRGDVGGG